MLDDAFLGSAAVAAGLVTRSQLASPRYRRLHRGVYAPAGMRVDHRLMCRSALLLVPSAVVAGRSAAWLWGARSAARATDPVTLAVASSEPARRRAGMVVRRLLLGERDSTLVQDLPVTTAPRTAWDLAATEKPVEAVCVVDEMLRHRALTPVALTEVASSRSGHRGGRRALRTLALTDAGAESPPESRVRVALAEAGLHPRTQVEVRDGTGRFVARVDMAFEDVRLAVEYDGGWHAEPGQLSRDRDRINRLHEAGWTVLFVTAPDLYRLEVVVDRVRGALLRLRGA